MAKLYFRHGTVGSAKTLNLLAVAHNYQQQGKKVVLLKPALDTRFGQGYIRSRAGLEKPADFLINPDTNILSLKIEPCDCILVDEAQFLSKNCIEQLRQITRARETPVICYGLRTDFKGRMFTGSLRLMELADTIEEVKTTCAFCTKKAIFNLKLVDGIPTMQGPQIDLGTEEKYLPACYRCFAEKLGDPT